MPRTFFPDPAFGWVFCVSLFLLTCVAAWTDTRSAKIPNRLTVLIFVLGLVINAARSGWLSADGKPIWVFETGAAWVGVIDGVLFAFVGFVVAFAVMFVFWIFGMCGGGDVKLLAAVAAWIGFDKNLVWLWLASVVFLFFWMTARILSGGMSPKQLSRTKKQMKKADEARKEGSTDRKGQLRVTYSLPIAVATAVVLLWGFRFELGLVPPKEQPAQQGTAAHARTPPLGT